MYRYPIGEFRFKGMDRLPAVSDTKVSSKCIVPDWRVPSKEWIGYRLYRIKYQACIGPIGEVPFQGEWIALPLYRDTKYQVNVSVPDWRVPFQREWIVTGCIRLKKFR
ncbi:hypothetical protein AVEN_236939-1 [Araneus ventricosus]|uniref:Uncharacterized protein n=1 Tax=Araneus ventricosus TaxID=182803 RepID=A0A4Y2LGQ9_ARAVE|nr:hypothetical protein AVEN_236939-1 [Araneus ventricosus]